VGAWIHSGQRRVGSAWPAIKRAPHRLVTAGSGGRCPWSVELTMQCTAVVWLGCGRAGPVIAACSSLASIPSEWDFDARKRLSSTAASQHRGGPDFLLKGGGGGLELLLLS